MIFSHTMDPVAFVLGGVTLRWYGLFFSGGILVSYLYVRSVYEREGLNGEEWDSLTLVILAGLALGARLAYVLVYRPSYYLENPLKILYVWQGGISSHGALAGILLAAWLWCRKREGGLIRAADLAVLGIPLTAAAVRLGNFMNSEIPGVYTGSAWGVIFTLRGDTLPRHPVQLYEAALLLAVFAVLFVSYRKMKLGAPPGLYTALFLFLYFGGRCLLELLKERQVFPVGYPVTIGLLLSILPAGAGAFLLYRIGRRARGTDQ
jgi:phosphatidylglycerol:prolipoprotein diacylglycerol transferase